MICFGLKPIIEMFNNHSVSVTGEKGAGKDVLFGNVIARKKHDYISNLDYTLDDKFHSYIYSDFDVDMSYRDLINGKIKYYSFPYSDHTDIYLSDSGCYFPSQYNGELNRDFKSLPLFMSLSRQLGDCCVHTNQQVFARVWDKIREHSTRFINCNFCKFIFGKIVILNLYTYDRAESCNVKMKPCQYRLPMLASREQKQRAKLYFDDFENRNGQIKSYTCIFINKSKHDTYYFRKLFERGLKKNEN